MAMELAKLQQEGLSEIKTPQELVHIRHDISILQYKYWMLMLRTYRELYEEGERCGPDDFCYLSMEGLTEALGYQPKTNEIKEDLRAIRKQEIIFNVLEKDGKQAQTGSGFISDWYVSSARVGVRFPPELRRAVENLDRKDSIFHLLNWQIFNSFSGKYEAIIYKLCKDYVGVGWTKKFSVDQYREYMGIGLEEYSDFKRLNQWCISGPVKRINESELSDIEIAIHLTREKRRVVAIQFEVSMKRQTALDFGDDPAFRFAKVKITPTQQRKYLSGKDPQVVEFSIRRANEYADEKEKKGESVDIRKVYAKAITEEWGVDFKKKIDEKEAKAEEKRKKTKTAEESAKEASFRKAFEDAWKAKAKATLKSMDDSEVRKLYEVWLSEAQRSPLETKAGVNAVAFHIWAYPRVLPRPEEAEFEAWRASNELG